MSEFGDDDKPLARGRRSSQGRFSGSQIDFLAFWRSTIVEKNVEIEGARPPRRDPRRNSVQDAGLDVKNGGMAIHLVTNLGRLGSVGVPEPVPDPFGDQKPLAR